MIILYLSARKQSPNIRNWLQSQITTAITIWLEIYAHALVQAKEFSEVAEITGIVLTKMDGTAKGGIAVAIQSELSVPVKYIGVGETIDDLQKFDSDEFVNALFTTSAATSEQN